MVDRSSSSPFKYVFWGILLILVLTVFGPFLWLLGRTGWMEIHGFPSMGPFFGPGVFLPAPMLLLVILYVVGVGMWVHRDASRRGMDPWLWATIAVFVPFFVGLIIYLVVRSNAAGTKCIGCNRLLQKEFRVCPYCGMSQERLCAECGTRLAMDWRVCPKCGKPVVRSQGPEASSAQSPGEA